MDRGIPVHLTIQRIMNSRVFLRSAQLEDGWAAFWALESSRQQGFGQGHIPMSEICAFAQLYGYEAGSTEVEDLVWTIQILDSEYLTIQAEKAAREREAVPKEPRRGSHRT